MSGFKGVLFDLGNTLLHFDGAWPEVFARSDEALMNQLLASGLDLDVDAFTKLFRERLNEYYEQRESEFIEHTTAYVLQTLLAELGYPDVPDEVIRPALEQMYRVSQNFWIAEDDAVSTLQALQSAGYKLGVVSNASDDADVQTLVDKAGIRYYLDFALSSAACGIRKPNPRIFDIALENWGFGKDEVVMVGDTLGADILGAKNAGIFSVWITRRADAPGNRDHAETIFPDAQIETLAELPGLLEELAYN